jgi:hypothetical protein
MRRAQKRQHQLNRFAAINVVTQIRWRINRLRRLAHDAF